MNTEIKVLLTVVTEGATLHRRAKTEFIPYVITDKNNKVIEKGKREYRGYDIEPAILETKICQEAYDYMTSDVVPSWMNYKKKEWKKMTAIERLEKHLARICASHNGISFTYSVVD